MNFGITIKHDRKNIRLLVEKVSETNTQEKYKVIERNQSFVLQNNRPLLIAKGLKYFPVKWKVVEGGYNHSSILEQITKAIEKKTLPSID
jgi:hypothetical protein